MMKFTPTPEMLSAAHALCMAKAYTQTVRPIVENKQRELLETHKYPYGAKYIQQYMNHNLPVPAYISDVNNLYMLEESDFDQYLKEMHAFYIESGFKVEFGSCPLLIAERLEREATDVLNKAMECITKLTKDMVFCSADAIKNWNELTDLTLKLLVPYLKNQKVN